VITGDMFRIDDEGYFWYEGRADELLKVGGVWVSPNEIENCLLEHPSVAEAAVVGCADADDLVKPKAFVVPRAGRRPADEAAAAAFAVELQSWVKSRLAPYKYPRWVELLAELPKNDRGKVDRKELKGRQAARAPAPRSAGPR
jgi:acyl-coenzyme A synthetase/AMP-(fatty) acid ligase